MLRRYCGLLALLGCAACSPPTQLLVVVDTDLEPGVEVGSIEVAASAPGGLADWRVFPLESTELPFSLGVRPARRDDEAVLVVVRARAPDGANVVEFRAETHFVPGEVRVLEAPLARACRNEVPCHDQGMTCVRGECVSSETDPLSLPARRGDEPQPLFDGPRVAPDGGSPDAGPACVAGEPCDTGDPCRSGASACDPPRCEVTGMLAPDTECGEGRVCDAEGRCGGLQS